MHSFFGQHLTQRSIREISSHQKFWNFYRERTIWGETQRANIFLSFSYSIQILAMANCIRSTNKILLYLAIEFCPKSNIKLVSKEDAFKWQAPVLLTSCGFPSRVNSSFDSKVKLTLWSTELKKRCCTTGARTSHFCDPQCTQGLTRLKWLAAID